MSIDLIPDVPDAFGHMVDQRLGQRFKVGHDRVQLIVVRIRMGRGDLEEPKSAAVDTILAILEAGHQERGQLGFLDRPDIPSMMLNESRLPVSA
jgi:hypothetical protein